MMTRRSLRLLLAATPALAACATAAPRDPPSRGTAAFVSDRVGIVTRGEGPDIILVPGLASHRDVWAGVAESLDDDYRLHLVQVNGFAGLEAGANADGPVSAPVAEELARYIRDAGLERPAVIGHSLGGSIGIMLAARHPELVGRLMIVDMMPFLGAMFGPPGTTPESVRPVADQVRARILAEPAGSPTGLLETMFPTMTRVESMRAVLRDGLLASDRRTVANAFHEAIVTDLRPELARIAAPVTALYVVPPDTPVPPAEFDRGVRESFAHAPGARIVRVEESNHFIMFDQPARFVAEVVTFMRTP
jgi:pimeloyl-ACP methyl ester carboxylesterase